jgi:hypothetical protein
MNLRMKYDNPGSQSTTVVSMIEEERFDNTICKIAHCCPGIVKPSIQVHM